MLGLEEISPTTRGRPRPFKRETLFALDAGLAAINDGPKLRDLPTLWVHGAEDQLVPIGETRVGIETLGFGPRRPRDRRLSRPNVLRVGS